MIRFVLYKQNSGGRMTDVLAVRRLEVGPSVFWERNGDMSGREVRNQINNFKVKFTELDCMERGDISEIFSVAI